MKACGVDLQPPRLPTLTTRACGAGATIPGLTGTSAQRLRSAHSIVFRIAARARCFSVSPSTDDVLRRTTVVPCRIKMRRRGSGANLQRIPEMAVARATAAGQPHGTAFA